MNIEQYNLKKAKSMESMMHGSSMRSPTFSAPIAPAPQYVAPQGLSMPQMKGGLSPIAIPKGAEDSDGDGVEDLYDCEPKNPEKQGFMHKVGAYMAEKVGMKETAENIRTRGREVDERKSQEASERAVIREKETIAYKQEKQKQAERIGKEKAKIEAEQQIRVMKQRAKPQSLGMSGIFGPAIQRKTVPSMTHHQEQAFSVQIPKQHDFGISVRPPSFGKKPSKKRRK